ncbi:hypothetical protein IRT45_13065 [Nocardia sp. BSTN01]|nr:hypothetical protein [Nocardia sp. BSTN01]MBF4998082.1 hypothetical protein [Nocardia sp. BSTN01]
MVLPFFVGGGVRLTDSLDARTDLEFESSRPLARGGMEIVYRVVLTL